MAPKTPAGVWAWIAVVCSAAVGLALWDIGATPNPAPQTWRTLALLAAMSAAADLFPIQSNFTMFRSATVRLTNVGLVAGALLLPLNLLAILPALALTPATLRQWRKPGALRRWLFNVGQTTLAILATGHWLQGLAGVRPPLGQLLVLVGAIGLVTCVQVMAVAIIISLNSRVTLRQTGTLSWPHVTGDLVANLLGVFLGRVWAADPALTGLFPILTYLAYLMIREAHLTYLAKVDPKTGLRTYRYFQELVAGEIERRRSRQRPLALLFCDLDFMRRVNNKHGHLAGDQVLAEVAQIITATIGSSGTAARFGGEEFVVLLPDHTMAQAVPVAERVRQGIADCHFRVPSGAVVRCTVSIGVAAYPEHARDWEDLIEKADLAMYRAKEVRNKVMTCA